MQSTSCDVLDWMTHTLESRMPGEIAAETTLMAENKEEIKSLSMKVKESEKAGLNFLGALVCFSFLFLAGGRVFHIWGKESSWIVLVWKSSYPPNLQSPLI